MGDCWILFYTIWIIIFICCLFKEELTNINIKQVHLRSFIKTKQKNPEIPLPAVKGEGLEGSKGSTGPPCGLWQALVEHQPHCIPALLAFFVFCQHASSFLPQDCAWEEEVQGRFRTSFRSNKTTSNISVRSKGKRGIKNESWVWLEWQLGGCIAIHWGREV